MLIHRLISRYLTNILFRREDLLSFIVSISPGQTVTSSSPPPVDQLLRTGDFSAATDASARPQAAQPLPSLQDMLDLSRPDSGERYKRPAPPSSPSHDESMDSPSCKRSRMN